MRKGLVVALAFALAACAGRPEDNIVAIEAQRSPSHRSISRKASCSAASGRGPPFRRHCRVHPARRRAKLSRARFAASLRRGEKPIVSCAVDCVGLVLLGWESLMLA